MMAGVPYLTAEDLGRVQVDVVCEAHAAESVVWL